MNTKNTESRAGGESTRKPAIGYVRVSTDRQGATGISLDAQRVAISEFAKKSGHFLIQIFGDISSGVGAKSLEQRKNLGKALDLVSERDAVLIVWDWDRLSRYSGFDDQVLHRLGNKGRVICAKTGNDMNAASQDAIFAHGEFIAKEISSRTKQGMAAKRAEGAVHGNPEIRIVQKAGTKANSDHSKELVGQIADVLREHDTSSELTHLEIANLLNAKGMRTLHDKKWDKSRIRQPLKEARKLLELEEIEHYRNNPLFGAF